MELILPCPPKKLPELYPSLVTIAQRLPCPFWKDDYGLTPKGASAVDRKGPAPEAGPTMDADENLPRRKDDLPAQLGKQDLDPYSVEELEERVALLEAEIARTKTRIECAVNHRASADALFKR